METNRLNYYPHHIGDFNNATRHLTRVERALYRELIELYYDTEKPLTGDIENLCKRVLVSCDEERAAVEMVLREFFSNEAGVWKNKRCDAEIKAYRLRQKNARKNGALGGRPKKTNAVIPANPNTTQRKTNHKPITNNQKPNKEEEVAVLPPWLPKDEWKALLEVRKGKKLVNSPRALKLLLTELERLKSLGFDPAKVLDQSTLKSWTSVYPLKVDLMAVSVEPKGKLCDYCAKVATGMVNGRRACDADWDKAMSNTPPLKAVA